MIESISIRGFQRHKRLRIEFGPGITTIIGATNAGKSSLIRALRWVILNAAPRNFINHDDDRAQVALSIDGRTLKRRRAGASNEYVLGDKSFKAFARAVPEQIARGLKMDEINFQQQRDQFFWFDLAPPEISRELNAIVNLSAIDEVQAKLAAKVRSTRAAVEFTGERLRDAETELKRLEFVPAFRLDVKALAINQDRHETAQAQVAGLAACIDQIATMRATLQTEYEAPNFAPIDDSLVELHLKQRDAEFLAGRIAEMEELERAAKTADHEASVAHTAFHLQIKGEACPVCGGPLHVK